MSTSYQMHEIKAYYGDFFESFEKQVSKHLEIHDWDFIVSNMDNELYETLNAELTPCSHERFLLAYMMAHTDKYGTDFTIV